MTNSPKPGPVAPERLSDLVAFLRLAGRVGAALADVGPALAVLEAVMARLNTLEAELISVKADLAAVRAERHELRGRLQIQLLAETVAALEAPGAETGTRTLNLSPAPVVPAPNPDAIVPAGVQAGAAVGKEGGGR